MKKGEKRKTGPRKTAAPVLKKSKKSSPQLTASGADETLSPDRAATPAGGSQAREEREEVKAEMTSPSTEGVENPANPVALPVGGATQAPLDEERVSDDIGPASKASERGGLHPALPVGGATQAPLMDEAIEFLGLSLNREEYAIPISQIKEIIRPVEMTAIPRSTPGLMGIISLRGVIIPVFNLKNKLAHIQSESREKIGPASNASERGGLHPALPVGGATQAPLDREDPDEAFKRIIIIQIDEGMLGLFVDEVTEVIKIKESDIQPSPPLFSQNGQELIRGITRYKERLVILLFIPRVIGVIKEEVEQIARV
jgi:purine-binding chemotaxis protein CheW